MVKTTNQVLINSGNPKIHLPLGDGFYHPSMVTAGMVYNWVYNMDVFQSSSIETVSKLDDGVQDS
jgi:hypothetical protein